MGRSHKLILAIGLVWTALAFGAPSEQFFSTDPYTILGISSGSDIDAIRRAHRSHGVKNQFEGDNSLTEEVRIERIWTMKRVNMAVAALRAGESYVTPPDTMPNGDPMPVKASSGGNGGGNGGATSGRRTDTGRRPESGASPEQEHFAKYASAIRAARDPQELRALWDACFQREGPMAFFDGLREAFAWRFVEFVRDAKDHHGRASAFYFYGTSNLEVPGLPSGLDAMMNVLPEGPLRNQFNFVDRVRARDRMVGAGTDRSLLFAYASAADRVHATDGAGTSFNWKDAFDSVEAKVEPLREYQTFEPFLKAVGNAWASDPHTFQAEARRERASLATHTDSLMTRRKMVGLGVVIPAVTIAAACIGPCLANMSSFSPPELILRLFPGTISGLAAYLAWKEMMTETDTMVRGRTLLGNFQVKVNELGQTEKSWTKMIDAMRDLHPWIGPAHSSAYPYSSGRPSCSSLFKKFVRSVVNYVRYP